MLQQEIRFIFADLVAIATYNKWGPPCSALTRMALSYPDDYTALIDRMATEPYGEFVLNGAGLVLYWLNRTDLSRPIITFGGDQVHLYPEFIYQAGRRLEAWNNLAPSSTHSRSHKTQMKSYLPKKPT